MISLRIADEDAVLFRKYAELRNLTMSEMIRQAVLSSIEREYDMEVYRDALRAFREDGSTVPLEEVEERIRNGEG